MTPEEIYALPLRTYQITREREQPIIIQAHEIMVGAGGILSAIRYEANGFAGFKTPEGASIGATLVLLLAAYGWQECRLVVPEQVEASDD